jgi:quercetin dioxygenase-like cupin family protein
VGTDEVMLVMNTIDPVMEPAPHSHTFCQIACIVAGRARYTVGPETYDVGPGSVLVIPAGVVHHIEPTGDDPVLNLDVFAPPRADYAHLVEWMSDKFAVSPSSSPDGPP